MKINFQSKVSTNNYITKYYKIISKLKISKIFNNSSSNINWFIKAQIMNQIKNYIIKILKWFFLNSDKKQDNKNNKFQA